MWAGLLKHWCKTTLITGNEKSMLIFLAYHLVMAHSSNIIIHRRTFNSGRGDFHINNKDSGKHDFRSQKSILIDDLMKDFIS